MARAMVERLSYVVPSRDDRDGVPLALVFAHEHRAWLEAPGGIGSRPAAAREAFQKLCGIRIKPAEGLLLDVPAEEPRHEVSGEGRRRGRPQRRAAPADGDGAGEGPR